MKLRLTLMGWIPAGSHSMGPMPRGSGLRDGGLRWAGLLLGGLLLLPGLGSADDDSIRNGREGWDGQERQISGTRQLESPGERSRQVSDRVDEDDEDAGPPGLDQSVIQKVIRSHMPAIKHCYNRELRKDASLSGRVLMKFTITPKGGVDGVSVAESSLGNKNVESCMVDDIKTWEFPEPRGEIAVDIKYPFKFSSVG